MLKRMGIGATIFACAMASAVAPGLASAPVPHVCSGTKKSPGVLSGNYNSPVEIKGYCTVNKGPAQVAGRLHLLRGSVLLAAYGEHNSHLTVSGSAYMRAAAPSCWAVIRPRSHASMTPIPSIRLSRARGA